MSVVIRDDELELFKQNGVTQDQIANTVSTYRNQGLSDNDIRSKVDVKLNEYRSAIPQQQIQQEPTQPITPVNGIISGGVTATRTPNWDSNGNVFYTDENGNKIKGDPWYKQPLYWAKGASARAKNVLQGKGTTDENIDYALNSALIVGSLGAATPAVMAKQGIFTGVKNFGRNQLAKLANNPTTRNITRNALKSVGKFAKSGIGKTTNYLTNLGKEGALYGAAHHGLNNVYGVENENSLLGDMAQDAGAFMTLGGILKGAGATGRFANKQLNKKGGVIRNAKADMLRFKRSHPVATRRVDSAISQVKEAIAPTAKYVVDKYYQGVETLNKLKEKAFANVEDMLTNDQLAFAKKAGHIDTGSELGNAKEELRRINALKNKSNVNIDFDSIENTSYERALDDLVNQGLKESEARSILSQRGMYDPATTEQLFNDIENLKQKVGMKAKADPINGETLNKIEQAIDEGKPITKESIHGNQEDVLPNGNPASWRDNVRAWREKQQAKSTESQPETSEHDLNMGKQELGINTPKEDLTHANEPSTSSNDIKPVRQDRVTDVSEEDRKTIDRLWRKLNYIDAKEAGSAKPPYTKYPHRVVEGRMNRYSQDGYKAQIAYDKAVNQVKALKADPRIKNIMLDDIDKAADTYTKNHGVEIKRTQHSEVMQGKLELEDNQIPQKTEVELFKEDLDNRLKASINEAINAGQSKPPMYNKMLKIKNDLKRGYVEYSSKKAFDGLKNGNHGDKPVITTIKDLMKHDTKIAKDFEGLEDVVIEVRAGRDNGTNGVYNEAKNTIWASDIESLYHEMQHYLQFNFSALPKEELIKLGNQTKTATRHIHKYTDFVNNKLEDFNKQILNAQNIGDEELVHDLMGEKHNFLNRAEHHYDKWRDKYENSPLEIDAHYAEDNLTLIKNNSIVDMQKGYNYARQGKISDTRLFDTKRQNFAEDRILENKSDSLWKRRRSFNGISKNYDKRINTATNRIRSLGSKGLNDRGVIETLSKINDGETAEIATKALRENTLKRTGLLEAEQAAKAINIQEGNGSVWIQSNVPSKVVKTTDVLGKEAKNQKAGAFGNRKSGEIKYTTREDRIKDDFMTAIRADNADALASHGITYSVPLDRKVEGKWVNVNKKALVFGIYTKNSGEWVQTLLAGDKAIEKVFKKEGEDVVNYMKQLSKNIGKPDCKIPQDVFDMLFDGSAENSKQYLERYWGMSFDHKTSLGNIARGVGKFLGGLADGYNAGWKRNKLATLSFIINNRLGNQMLMMAHGGKDYLTSLIEAARMKDTDIPNEILSANIGEAFTDFIKASPGQKTAYTGYGIDKLFHLISGVKLEQVNTKPLTRLKAKDIPVLKKSEYKITNSDKLEKVAVDNSKHKSGSKIGSIYKNGRGNAFPMYAKKLPKNAKFARVVKNPNNTTKVKFDNTMSKLYNSAAWVDRQFARYAKVVNKINDKFERFERKQAYSIAKKQYDRAKVKDFLYKTELYKNMANDINKNPIAKDAILAGIENMLGNYRTFTKFEKNFLKRIRPFYSWDRTITRSTLALAKKNPARAAWILYETKRLQNIQPDRKDYQQGSIDLPIKDSRNNKQLLINKLEYGDPWSSFPGISRQKFYEGLAPWSPLSVPKEMIQGHKNFIDQEFNDRRYFAVKGKDSKGKKTIQYYDRKEKKLIDKLPLAPRINYGVKQLLTDQVMPVMNNNLIKGDNLLGLLSDKHREYDSAYDTSFGGYYDKDYVGTTTKMSKRGYPYKKKLYRQSAQDTSPTTKLLQRTGLSIQTKQPLSYYDKQERKEKAKKWREKHKKNK